MKLKFTTAVAAALATMATGFILPAPAMAWETVGECHGMRTCNNFLNACPLGGGQLVVTETWNGVPTGWECQVPSQMSGTVELELDQRQQRPRSAR